MYTATPANWNDSIGTHFVGTIVTTRRALTDAFGEPTDGDGYKVQHEWILRLTSETLNVYVATVYDWKNYGPDGDFMPIGMDEPFEWHIGGKHDFVVRIIESLVGRQIRL